MGESTKCQLCSKDATVHLTQILNSQIVKVDLCESCAKELGVTDPYGFSLTELLQKIDDKSGGKVLGPAALQAEKPSVAVCDTCGFTQSDFKRRGRLGCSDCYESFEHLLKPLLKDMHADVAHVGKVPQRMMNRLRYRQQIRELESDLQTAVAEERYEEAARCRDRIAQLRDEAARNPS